MTSAQIMRRGTFVVCRVPPLRACFGVCWAGLILLASALAGCRQAETLQAPISLASPYREPKVWAVAPFNNESGVSSVLGDRVADAFAAEIQQVDGFDSIPVNRVIAAMRRLNIPVITTPAEARSLRAALAVDGLLVGTVTAYDPFRPPRFGASIALFTSEASDEHPFDAAALSRAATEPALHSTSIDAPEAQVAGLFDASNHRTLAQLQEYAAGRQEPGSAFGAEIYLVRMDLYTQFAAHRLLHDLFAFERARAVPVPATNTDSSR